jgi:hypothetical protein
MNEIEALVNIVSNVELAEKHWDTMPGFLKLLTVLRHRELAERLPPDVLGPTLNRYVMSRDDEQRAAMVAQVVADYVHQQNSATN